MEILLLLLGIIGLVLLIFNVFKFKKRKRIKKYKKNNNDSFEDDDIASLIGKEGEQLVSDELKRLSCNYIVLNDLFFASNNKSVQIDHIVISPYGIFVIETKNYKGWILGGEKSDYWYQVFYKSKYLFYNPIKQNESHIKFLSYLLRYCGEIPFVPIVVFNNVAELKCYVKNHIVINKRDLIKCISCYRNVVLNDWQVNNIIEIIKCNNITPNKQMMEKHIKYVQNKRSELVN